MKKCSTLLGKIMVFITLTIVTQIGGIVYLLSLFVSKKWKSKFKFKKIVVFSTLYLLFTFLIVPLFAPLLGREKVKHSKKIQPTNYSTVLLNRNYVSPKLNKLLQVTEEYLKETPIQIHYLDANFPFFNGFPLLPHKSHNDGKKLDISFIYETLGHTISNQQKSVSGYGVFEYPKPFEFNQTKVCLEKGYFQYDYSKYLTFGTINTKLVFSEKGTKKLITSILKNKNLGKLFIEPHLKKRLQLTDNRIRFHGCGAVRHDDHIHIQLH